jgi:stage V sporulation protein M
MIKMEPRTDRGGMGVKFYTIKLPKFLGGFVKAILNTFWKN